MKSGWPAESGGISERDEIVVAGVGQCVETAGFEQLGEQTFASQPSGLEFGLNTGKREFGTMQFEGFQK